MKRKKIPKEIKEVVKIRQNCKCACCLDFGREYHHVIATSRIFGEYINSKNVVLLCKKHHKLFHLGDPETYQTVYEYVWYIIYGYLPENKDLTSITEEVFSKLKKDFGKELSK